MQVYDKKFPDCIELIIIDSSYKFLSRHFPVSLYYLMPRNPSSSRFQSSSCSLYYSWIRHHVGNWPVPPVGVGGISAGVWAVHLAGTIIPLLPVLVGFWPVPWATLETFQSTGGDWAILLRIGNLDEPYSPIS